MHVCTLWAHLRLCTVYGAAVKKNYIIIFMIIFFVFFYFIAITIGLTSPYVITLGR